MSEHKPENKLNRTPDESRMAQLLNLVMVSMVILVLAVVATGILLYVAEYPQHVKQEIAEVVETENDDSSRVNQVKDGLDVETGFVAEGDYLLVKSNCTACHSSKLVLQNRATKEGWEDMIRWMQKTQKLWDLGENEEKILTYLSTYYGPEKKGRRGPLAVEEWYEIN